MKNLIYIVLGLLFIYSCEKDEKKAVVAENPIAPEFTSPSDGSDLILQQADKDKELMFTWENADYGFPTIVGYIIQMDTLNGIFNKPQTFGTTNNDTAVIKTSDLNSKFLSLKLKAGVPNTIRLRLRATVGEVMDTLYSKELKLNVTPY
jgi:hypothetical protein